MAQLKYEQLQEEALDSIDSAGGAARGGDKEGEARLLAVAQVHALLAVGAAIRELAQAVREHE